MLLILAILLEKQLTHQGEEVKDEDPSQFVSSLCWKRKDPNVLLAANSQGRIKVLEMI